MKKDFIPDPDSENRTTHILPAIYSWPETHHEFDDESEWAVRTALATGRPLLVRGEPGMGKSQLARAAAKVLSVPFLYHVIDARTEVEDLLYKYDAVSRLARAQLLGAVKGDGDWREELAEAKFVEPGPLWWAFNWADAREQSKTCYRDCAEPPSPPDWKPGQGCVVLIDEIDKADGDVPNGLLESLGNCGFQIPLLGRAVALPRTEEDEEPPLPPLVIVTTNEERELPGAFLRRCLVLQMEFPEGEEKARKFLLNRARKHWPEQVVSDQVLQKAAEQLLEDRAQADRLGPTRPGAAEFLDLVTALAEIAPGDETQQLEDLKKVQGFALRKHPKSAGA